MNGMNKDKALVCWLVLSNISCGAQVDTNISVKTFYICGIQAEKLSRQLCLLTGIILL